MKRLKHLFLTLLAFSLLALPSQSQAIPIDNEFGLYVFPNATSIGTIVEIDGIREYADICIAHLNNVEMPVIERFDTSIKVLVPHTISGFPTISVNDYQIGISFNQLYVLQPDIFFEDWVPVPLLESATIVGLIHPGETDPLVLELYAGDKIAIDLVGINPVTWYPYEYWEPCRFTLGLWPLNIVTQNTTFTGPKSWYIHEDGLYIFNLQTLCNWGSYYLLTIVIS